MTERAHTPIDRRAQRSHARRTDNDDDPLTPLSAKRRESARRRHTKQDDGDTRTQSKTDLFLKRTKQRIIKHIAFTAPPLYCHHSWASAANRRKAQAQAQTRAPTPTHSSPLTTSCPLRPE